MHHSTMAKSFCENLVDSKPVSDSDSDSEKFKCYQSGQMGFLFNWLLLFLFLFAVVCQLVSQCDTVFIAFW